MITPAAVTAISPRLRGWGTRYQSMLPHRCTINRRNPDAVETGPYGRDKDEWNDPTEVESNTPCRLVPRGGREIVDGEKKVVSDHTLHLLSRNIPVEQDRVILSHLGSSRTFLIQLVREINDRIGPHHFEVDLILERRSG